MSPMQRYANKQAKARQRRRHTAAERLQRDHAQAQRAIEALAQALHAVGLPDNLVQEIEGRLRRGVIAPFPNLTSFDVATHKEFSLTVQHDERNQMVVAIQS